MSQTDLFTILHISARTWQRHTDEKLLPQDVTEKALQLANLYKQGESVFGDPRQSLKAGWTLQVPSLAAKSRLNY